MSTTPPERFEQLRHLAAQYWKPLASLMAGIPVVLNVLKALGLDVGELPGVASTPTTRYWLIGLGSLIFIIFRFPRVAMIITSLILGPSKPAPSQGMIFRGPRPYGSEDKLPGRNAEPQACWMLIRQKPFFILEGESGCGKSSLLSAALIPKLREKFRIVECRIADDPLGKLYCALRREPYRKRDQTVSEKELAEAIATAAQSTSTEALTNPETNKSLLLCIDQFEELFVTVKDEVRRRFLVVLKDAIADAKLRLLVAIRSDFRDLLDKICREVDSEQEALDLGNDYTLRAYRKEQAEAVLAEILAPVHGNDPLLKQQLEDFGKALVRELLRPPRDRRLCLEDEKTILPVELQTVGMMIESVGVRNFSAEGLNRLGGKIGLFRAYVEDAKTHVRHKTGISGEKALLILRRLISPAQTKWAQTAQSIGEALNVPVDQVEKVLEAFADKYLVKRLPEET